MIIRCLPKRTYMHQSPTLTHSHTRGTASTKIYEHTLSTHIYRYAMTRVRCSFLPCRTNVFRDTRAPIFGSDELLCATRCASYDEYISRYIWQGVAHSVTNGRDRDFKGTYADMKVWPSSRSSFCQFSIAKRVREGVGSGF